MGSGETIEIYKETGFPLKDVVSRFSIRAMSEPTALPIAAWRRNRQSRRWGRIPFPPGRTSAWCIMARFNHNNIR